MKPRLTAHEINRLNHINFVCDENHGSVNNIYENLVDNESEYIKKLKKLKFQVLILKLKQILADAKEEV